MKILFTFFLSFAFVLAAFAVFDAPNVSASEKQTVNYLAKYSPAVQNVPVNFGNPQNAEYVPRVIEYSARTSAVKIKRKPKKYGFRLSHKNFYPPEKR